MLVNIYQIARCHNPEDSNLQWYVFNIQICKPDANYEENNPSIPRHSSHLPCNTPLPSKKSIGTGLSVHLQNIQLDWSTNRETNHKYTSSQPKVSQCFLSGFATGACRSGRMEPDELVCRYDTKNHRERSVQTTPGTSYTSAMPKITAIYWLNHSHKTFQSLTTMNKIFNPSRIQHVSYRISWRLSCLTLSEGPFFLV
jgi:hypothetical protein